MIIEPFDPDRHDRSSFSTGVKAVDNFFQRTAKKLSQANSIRVFVMRQDGPEVMGFYALNAHSITYQDLPPTFARNRPAHGHIPAAFIAMIGVDARAQGRGYGGDLLVDALLRILKASNSLGIAVVVLDILDDGDPEAKARRKALYSRYGFIALSRQPDRMILPVATIRRLLDPAEAHSAPSGIPG